MRVDIVESSVTSSLIVSLATKARIRIFSFVAGVMLAWQS